MRKLFDQERPRDLWQVLTQIGLQPGEVDLLALANRCSAIELNDHGDGRLAERHQFRVSQVGDAVENVERDPLPAKHKLSLRGVANAPIDFERGPIRRA